MLPHLLLLSCTLCKAAVFFCCQHLQLFDLALKLILLHFAAGKLCRYRRAAVTCRSQRTRQTTATHSSVKQALLGLGWRLLLAAAVRTLLEGPQASLTGRHLLP